MTGASNVLDPVEAAKDDISRSKRLIASTLDDLTQHHSWLESYHRDERRRAQRLRREDALRRLELRRQRAAWLSRRFALATYAFARATSGPGAERRGLSDLGSATRPCAFAPHDAMDLCRRLLGVAHRAYAVPHRPRGERRGTWLDDPRLGSGRHPLSASGVNLCRPLERRGGHLRGTGLAQSLDRLDTGKT